MLFEELTYQEIRSFAQSGALAVVPTGCTEQQGPHLPVGFDTWLVAELAKAAAQRALEKYGVEALVIPTLPFGPTPEHRNFGSGYIDLPQALHEAVIAQVLKSLAEQGFCRIIVWRGCGQHNLARIVMEFNETHHGQSKAFQPDLPYHRIWCQISDPAVPGGHADSFSTSLALFLRPESVRWELITDPKNDPVDWDDPNLDFARYSKTGVIGDPTHASAELGAKLWEAILENAGLSFREFASAQKSG